jgi:hypothetical protein
MLTLKAGAALAALAAALAAGEAAAADNAANSDQGLVPGRIIFESRLRYEGVDQAGLANNAEAVTLRTRYGWESPKVAGLQALIEGDNVVALDHDYFDGVTPNPGYPLVPDPEINRLNRAQVVWTGLPKVEFTLGRQRIALDNQRFVGNSGFRQTETTFDGARIVAQPIDGLKLTYAYIDRVNRSTGSLHEADSPWKGAVQLIEAEAKTPLGQLSAFDYLLDLHNAPTQSSQTWGARLVGSHPVSKDWSLTWEAELARERDYANNPQTFDRGYGFVSGGVKHGPWQASLGYEQLDGDGVHGFQTPLATKHPFDGWANLFLTTPKYGLRDLYLRGGATLPEMFGRHVRLAGEVHDFTAQHGGFDVGHEVDGGIYVPLTKHLTGALEAARFESEHAGVPNTSKLWLSFELKL